MRHATISQTCSLSRGPLQIGLNHIFSHILGLISQQEVPGGVFPFLKLLQINVFNLPPEGKEKVLKKGHNEDESPLRRTLSIAFSNEKLLGARVAVKTPEKVFCFSSLCNDFPPWVPPVDQPLVVYIIPGIYKYHGQDFILVMAIIIIISYSS